MYRILFLLLMLCFMTIAASGCTTSSPKPIDDSLLPSLTVAAASDLSIAFKEIGSQFEKKTNSKIEFTFGSTGTLSQQIENGAPYDIFAAANVSFVDGLRDKGLIIQDTQQLYGQGKIGLAVPLKSTLQVKDLEDLLSPDIKKIAIANPDHAPYGMAAKQALQNAGLWEKLQDKLVYGQNISDTLTLITTGNAETGIIALSLVRETEVKFQFIEPSLYEPLNQAIAVIEGTEQETLARQFALFVNEPESRDIMQKHGFGPPLKESE